MTATTKLMQRAADIAFRRALRTIAHSVGTPLNVISGRAELALEDAQSEEVRKNLESIIDQCRGLKQRIAAPLDAMTRVHEVPAKMLLSELLEQRDSWLLPELSTRVDVAMPDNGVRVPAADGALACFGLCGLAAALDDTGAKITLSSETTDAEVLVVVECQHCSAELSGPRALGEPWQSRGFPADGFMPALLIHGMAAENGRRALLEPTSRGMRIGIAFPNQAA